MVSLITLHFPDCFQGHIHWRPPVQCQAFLLLNFLPTTLKPADMCAGECSLCAFSHAREACFLGCASRPSHADVADFTRQKLNCHIKHLYDSHSPIPDLPHPQQAKGCQQSDNLCIYFRCKFASRHGACCSQCSENKIPLLCSSTTVSPEESPACQPSWRSSFQMCITTHRTLAMEAQPTVNTTTRACSCSHPASLSRRPLAVWLAATPPGVSPSLPLNQLLRVAGMHGNLWK